MNFRNVVSRTTVGALAFAALITGQTPGIAGAQHAPDAIVGGLEAMPFAHTPQSELVPENNTHTTENGAQFVLYGLKTDAGDVHCSGVSLGANQFLTSQHCTDAVESFDDITLFADPEANVEHVADVPDVDAAVVTLDTDVFAADCVQVSEEPVEPAETLDLYTVDVSSGGVHEEQLRVEQTDYVGKNADLGVVSHDLIRASAMDGSPTRPGDSGSPVFRKDSRGEYVLAGIVVGVSKSLGDVIVQPIAQIAGNILDECACCTPADPHSGGQCERPTTSPTTSPR